MNGDDGREGGVEDLLKGWISSLRQLVLLGLDMAEVVTVVSHEDGEGTRSESLGFSRVKWSSEEAIGKVS